MIATQSNGFTKADIVRDLIRRKRCRDNLHSFALNIDVPTSPVGALYPDEDITGPARFLMPIHHSKILEVAMRTILRPYGRALIMAPPGTAKSSYISVVVPPWAMGRIDKTRIILASYASTLAQRQARRARTIADSKPYRDIWEAPPSIIKDSDPEWTMSNGSEMLSAGITAGITGNRANGVIIDDPVAGREEADSPMMRKKILDAYQDDLLTRMLPGAWLILIMCMVGDTRVLMANGAEKKLRDVRPGDEIATYERGRLVTTVVRNWKNQGLDDVFKVQLRSGKTVTANARHPFLVKENGGCKWVRLQNLRVGAKLVVSQGVASRQLAKTDAEVTTISGAGLTAFAHRHSIRPHVAQLGLKTATALLRKSMRLCSRLKKAAAQFATSFLVKMFEHIGAANFASTTITKQDALENCFATTVTSLSAMGKHLIVLKQPPCTYDFTVDEIVSIQRSGREEVFDIQVERTENFIANGVVSHNTRWNEQDLAGEILPHDYKGQSGMIRCRDGLDWEVLNLPAKAEHRDDPLGRKHGEYIWPEYYDAKHWQMFENGVGPTRQRTWASLYQQRPSPQGSGKFTREMVRYYDTLPDTARRSPRVCCSDWAVSEGKNDFTEIGIAALDSTDDLYILDWFYEQCDTGKGMAKFIEMIARHNCQLAFNEGGVIDKAVRPTFDVSMRDYNAKARREGRRSIFCDLRSLPSMQDKLAKTSAIGARMAMGKVFFPRSAPWTERVVEQLLALPAGRFDDAADVMGLFGRGLDQFRPPEAPRLERKEGIKPFTAAWIEWKEETKPKVRYR